MWYLDTGAMFLGWLFVKAAIRARANGYIVHTSTVFSYAFQYIKYKMVKIAGKQTKKKQRQQQLMHNGTLIANIPNINIL